MEKVLVCDFALIVLGVNKNSDNKFGGFEESEVSKEVRESIQEQQKADEQSWFNDGSGSLYYLS